MSRIKKLGLKRVTFILGLVLLLLLGVIGIGYGAWNDLLNIDFTVDTAQFEPQVEVYKIEREHPNYRARRATFTLDPAIKPDGNGVITVNIGEDLPSPPSLRAIWDNAWRNDKYKVYYRVVNNSSIPIDYRTVEISDTAQEPYIAVSPDDTGWTAVGAGVSKANNYAAIEIKYKWALLPKNRVNPFNLAPWGQGGQIDQTIARVEIKQFNTDSTDSGWKKMVDIHICTNEFLDLDPSDSSNNLSISSGSGSPDRLNSSDNPGKSGDDPGDPPQDAESDSPGGVAGGESGGSGEGNAGEEGEPGEPVGDLGDPTEPDEAGEDNSQSDGADDSGDPGDSGNGSGDSGDSDGGDTGGADNSGSSGDPE